MVIDYLGTSAVLKLALAEAETGALFAYLQADAGASLQLHASWLLYTELHCAARRRPEVVDGETIGKVLELVTLTDLERRDLVAATVTPGRLRTADAIHLAVALRIGAETVISYDAELQGAAREAGLRVVAPA